MPKDTYFGKDLKKLVEKGKIDAKYVDNSVYRILLPMFQCGIFDYPNKNQITNNVTNQ